MSSNIRPVIMAVFALASIVCGGILAFLAGRGCGRPGDSFPAWDVPETVEPDFVFSAPEILKNGAVKSVRQSWPDGSDRLVYYYRTDGKKKELVRIREYSLKGQKKRETVFTRKGNALIISDCGWFQNGFLRFRIERRAESGPDGFDYSPEAGVLHGLYEEFWQTGACRRKGRYANGKREGIWHEWSGKDIRTLTEEYSEGKRSGLYRKWDPSGILLMKGRYRDGKRTGTWTFIKDDGSGYITRQYKEGE